MDKKYYCAMTAKITAVVPAYTRKNAGLYVAKNSHIFKEM